MTNFEKIKSEISSILADYKLKYIEDCDIDSPNNITISTSDILRNPSDIKSDMIFEMHESMNKHIELYGDGDKAEIVDHIKACDQSFSELWDVKF